MQRITLTDRFPHRQEELFALVAEVEAYPEFLPGWRSVEVRERSGNRLTVKQSVAVGRFALHFESRAVLDPPRSIHIESDHAAFRHFVLEWRFEPQGTDCLAQLDIECSFRSPLLERAAGLLIPTMARNIMTAFARRARATSSARGAEK